MQIFTFRNTADIFTALARLPFSLLASPQYFFFPIIGHDEADFSKCCHFPAASSSFLLFPPNYPSFHLRLTPHPFPSRFLQQWDLLLTSTITFSFSKLQGEAACWERHTAGYWQTCHCRYSQNLRLREAEGEGSSHPSASHAEATPLEKTWDETCTPGNQERSPALAPPSLLASQQWPISVGLFPTASALPHPPAKEKRAAKVMECRAKNNDFWTPLAEKQGNRLSLHLLEVVTATIKEYQME